MASPDDPLHQEPDMPPERRGSSILSNMAWSTFHLVLSKVIRFIAIAYCVRKVGPYTWGEIASTLVTVGFLYFLVDQGLGTAPALYKVDQRPLDNIFLKKINLYRLAMAAILIIALQMIHRLVMPVNHLVLIYSFALLPRALSLDWWFHRREKYHVTTGLASLRVFVFAIGAFLYVQQGDSPDVILYLEMAVEGLGCAAGYLLYRRATLKEPSVPPAPVEDLRYFELAKIGFPYLLIGTLITVHQSVDILFLKYMCGFKDVGEYDIGYKIAFFLFFIGAGVIQVIRPKLARLNIEGRMDTISSILSSCSKILAALGCGYLVISLYFSELIIPLIFEGTGSLTYFVFQWAPVWVAVAFMTMLCADTLLCLGEKKKYFRGALYCAIANVTTNYVLILNFGARGAIFATLISELVFLGYSYSNLPNAIRAPLAKSLVPQAGAFSAIILIFGISVNFESRIPFISASACVLCILLFMQGSLKKETISILIKN